MDKIIIYTDGGSRGNPGPSACAAVIKNFSGQIILSGAKYLGEGTNNQAEYQGVILALEKISELPVKPKELHFFLDSELVVNQLNQNYKVKDRTLQTLFVKVWNQLQHYQKTTFKAVPRESNKEADKLLNLKLDSELAKN